MWIKNTCKSGEFPVSPDTIVDVKFLNGLVHEAKPASNWGWLSWDPTTGSREDFPCLIEYYRLHTNPEDEFALEMIERARELYQSEDIEVDATKAGEAPRDLISEGDDGTWVRAYVFVPNQPEEE